jgi:hypothetical protein
MRISKGIYVDPKYFSRDGYSAQYLRVLAERGTGSETRWIGSRKSFRTLRLSFRRKTQYISFAPTSNSVGIELFRTSLRDNKYIYFVKGSLHLDVLLPPKEILLNAPVAYAFSVGIPKVAQILTHCYRRRAFLVGAGCTSALRIYKGYNPGKRDEAVLSINMLLRH